METLQLKKLVLNALLEHINLTEGDTITLPKTLLYNITMGELKDTEDFEELIQRYQMLTAEVTVNKELIN